MKSSYELAMERLNKTAPIAKLSAEQKKQIAELESKCKAKIAEREIALNDAGNAAAAAGDFEKMEQMKQQLIKERTELQVELEAKKDQIHQASARK